METSRNSFKSIPWPPSNSKPGVKTAMRVWLPSLIKYGMNYTGVTPINKTKDEISLGSNYFHIMKGHKCDASSLDGCQGKQKYIYVRGHPIGRLPTCTQKKDGAFETKFNSKVSASPGILGALQEDVFNLNTTDLLKSLASDGPYASKKCMSATLPVGNYLETSKRKNNKTHGWWDDTKCIPYEPTASKKYGNSSYQMPFSQSFCKKAKEKFLNKNIYNNKSDNYIAIFIIIYLIIIIYLNTQKYNNQKIQKYFLITFLFCYFIYFLNNRDYSESFKSIKLQKKYGKRSKIIKKIPKMHDINIPDLNMPEINKIELLKKIKIEKKIIQKNKIVKYLKKNLNILNRILTERSIHADKLKELEIKKEIYTALLEEKKELTIEVSLINNDTIEKQKSITNNKDKIATQNSKYDTIHRDFKRVALDGPKTPK
jgi:hypothetical protein